MKIVKGHGKIKSQLAEMSRQPKLNYSMLGAPLSGSYYSFGNSDTFVTIKSFFQVFNQRYRTSGSLYAIEEVYTERTDQKVVASYNGGATWEVLGVIPVDIAAGERINRLYVDTIGTPTFYFLKRLTASPDTYAVVSYTYNTTTKEFTLVGTLALGNKMWLMSSSSIDSAWASPNAVVMFGEYGGDTETELKIWKTDDRGAHWTAVFTQPGIAAGGDCIRHFHTCQVDPFTGHWWVTSGDEDAQCKIWKSEDVGATWTLQDSGTQELRNCGMVFENDYIYYAMDTPSSLVQTKIFKFTKDGLPNREIIGIQPENCAIRAITRTYFPAGFIIWPAIETGGVTGEYVTPQFYDYVQGELINLPRFYAMGKTTCGFMDAARYQDKFSGYIPVEFYGDFANAYPYDIATAGSYTSTKAVKVLVTNF